MARLYGRGKSEPWQDQAFLQLYKGGSVLASRSRRMGLLHVPPQPPPALPLAWILNLELSSAKPELRGRTEGHGSKNSGWTAIWEM